MRQAKTWWRDLGGLLAACVLALLVATPTLGWTTCLCEDDFSVSAASASVADLQAQTDQDGAPCKAACCQGGHCHPAGSAIDVSVATLAALAPRIAEHASLSSPVLSSRTLSALDRPPRA